MPMTEQYVEPTPSTDNAEDETGLDEEEETVEDGPEELVEEVEDEQMGTFHFLLFSVVYGSLAHQTQDRKVVRVIAFPCHIR